MKWLTWTPYHSVWRTAGSCFIQRLSSCFCPTSLAFVCTFFALLMMMKKKRKQQKQRKTQRPKLQWGEKQLHVATDLHQQTAAKEKVCAIVSCVEMYGYYYFNRHLYFRAEHTRMQRWSATVVPWWLHSLAWWRSSAGRVCSGPCAAFWLCRFASNHNFPLWHLHKECSS